MKKDDYLFAACSVMFMLLAAGGAGICYYLFTGDQNIMREMGIGAYIVPPLAVVLCFCGSVGFGLSAFSPRIRKKLFITSGDGDSFFCATCSYDLRGTAVKHINRCPECGDPVPAAQMRKIKKMSRPADKN